MGVVLIALSLADAVVFAFEFKAHGWSRAAIAEVIALVIFVCLGLGDWHLQTLGGAHDRIQTAKIDEATKAADKARTDASDATAKANDATQKATDATQKATDARKAALALESQLDPFLALAKRSYPSLDASTALNRLANEIDSVRDRTDSLERKSDALEQKVSPRHLSPEEGQKLVQAIHELGGVQSVSVVNDTNDNETRVYAEELAAALGGASCTVHRSALGPMLVTDLVIPYWPPSGPPPAAAVKLMTALQRAGLKVRLGPGENDGLPIRGRGLPNENDVLLFVGPKAAKETPLR